MNTKWLIWPALVFGTVGLLCPSLLHSEEQFAGKTIKPADATVSTNDETIEEAGRVPVAVARDRAKVMLDIYIATLDAMHRHYFDRERAVLPARALEDVFAEIQQQSNAEARWISVNLRAMSIKHEPKSAFEKQAAELIAAGQSTVEVIEDGYYRRAGAVSLADSCVNCHGGFFNATSKIPRFAGLVISIPISKEPLKSK